MRAGQAQGVEERGGEHGLVGVGRASGEACDEAVQRPFHTGAMAGERPVGFRLAREEGELVRPSVVLQGVGEPRAALVVAMPRTPFFGPHARIAKDARDEFRDRRAVDTR